MSEAIELALGRALDALVAAEKREAHAVERLAAAEALLRAVTVYPSNRLLGRIRAFLAAGGDPT